MGQHLVKRMPPPRRQPPQPTIHEMAMAFAILRGSEITSHFAALEAAKLALGNLHLFTEDDNHE